jgi:small GTP-binding protein
MFSDKYLTTIGVKIDKKVITVQQETMTLIIWDIAGENGYHKVHSSYLRGMSGYFLVADKTRMSTLDNILDVHERIKTAFPKVPHILLMNKIDLAGQWDIDDSAIDKLRHDGYDVMPTSAKTGQNVEEAFTRLAEKMLVQ